MTVISKVAEAIRTASRITVLTGAGISTGSGLSDFRSLNGRYKGYATPIEEILSENFFKFNPEKFWYQYRHIFQLSEMNKIRPNEGHFFLRSLELSGKDVTILTQNVDGLHQLAGSSNVFELHGSLQSALCPLCGQSYNIEFLLNKPVPTCHFDQTILKPDIALYGGNVRYMDIAYEAICTGDLFISAGTSLEVYPVSALPTFIANAPLISKVLVNNETTSKDHLFTYVIHDDITVIFSELARLLQLPEVKA